MSKQRKPDKPLLPLRDQLALDRTELANRRTWLASARTALALFVSGATFLQFFDAGWVAYVGWGFVGLTAPVVVAGYWRYHRQQRQLKTLSDEARALLVDRQPATS